MAFRVYHQANNPGGPHLQARGQCSVSSKCQKRDLYSIADYFEVPVPKNVRKAELKQLVLAGVVGRQVLTSSEPVFTLPYDEDAGGTGAIKADTEGEVGLGRVEVFHEGLWGNGCETAGTMLNAEVVCNSVQCGYKAMQSTSKVGLTGLIGVLGPWSGRGTAVAQWRKRVQ
ncbi:hypothetical protein CRUP_015193, partial [Coryphaenoides rupestris]